MEGKELQAVLSQAGEDHLGVALIRPGGSRYEQMKWQLFCWQAVFVLLVRHEHCNKGGTAYFTSLAIYDCKGLSYCMERIVRKGRKNHENHIKGRLREGVCRKQECI